MSLKTSWFSTPFPRPGYKLYFSIALVTGFSIAFILNVFQPFGTYNFKHSYKVLILTGYGVVTTLSIAFYYALSTRLIYKNQEQKWTVIKESIDLFLVLILSLLSCYFYFIWVFDGSFRLSRMFNFILQASLVSLLPVIGLFVFISSKYKGIIRSTLEIDEDSTDQQLSQQITLRGTNKSEVIQTSVDSVLYVKSEDNYIILSVLQQGQVQSHMIRSTLKQIEEQLSGHTFFKCHRSYIINTHRIDSISGNKNSAKLKISGSNQLIPVSRTKVDSIRQMIADQ